jgi:hypothetical protein
MVEEDLNVMEINPLNAKLNSICHLLALLGAHHILYVSRIRVKKQADNIQRPSGMQEDQCGKRKSSTDCRT